MHKIIALLIVLTVTATARAGEFNPVLNIGDPAPVWKDLPGVDGKQHSLSDLKDKDAVVVIFTCNSCPVAADYEDRIIAFTKAHAGPKSAVAVVAINVNKIEEDLLPAMKVRADEKQFPFVYLFDETQKIAKDYGATFTPEFFILDKERRIAYMGGFDDNSDLKQVKETYLEPALLALLSGKPITTPETVARGCTIRYARERRKKK